MILLLAIMLALTELTLIGLCIMPLLLYLIFRFKRVMSKNWQYVRSKRSNMNGYLHEALSGVRVTQFFVREEENAQIFEGANDEIRTGWMRAIKYNAGFWSSLDVTGTIGTVLVYYFGVQFMDQACSWQICCWC